MLLTIVSEMILVPYFLVGAFLIKISFESASKGLIIVGAVTSLYGLWHTLCFRNNQSTVICYSIYARFIYLPLCAKPKQ